MFSTKVLAILLIVNFVKSQEVIRDEQDSSLNPPVRPVRPEQRPVNHQPNNGPRQRQQGGIGGLLSGLLGQITKTADVSGCPGKCIHSIASLICDEVLADVQCPSSSMRCCVERDSKRPSKPSQKDEKKPTTTTTTTKKPKRRTRPTRTTRPPTTRRTTTRKPIKNTIDKHDSEDSEVLIEEDKPSRSSSSPSSSSSFPGVKPRVTHSSQYPHHPYSPTTRFSSARDTTTVANTDTNHDHLASEATSSCVLSIVTVLAVCISSIFL